MIIIKFKKNLIRAVTDPWSFSGFVAPSTKIYFETSDNIRGVWREMRDYTR